MPMPKRAATRKVTRAMVFPRRCRFSQTHYPRWRNNPGINNQAPARPQAQRSTERPLQRLRRKVSSRPPFARSKVIIQARCTVIIGGTTAVMSAFSRAIISWLHPIIASTSCYHSLPACTVALAAELRLGLHVLCPASQRAAI